MGVPNDRCGFELEPVVLIKRGKMFEGYEKRLFGLEQDQWHKKFHVDCCWREVWNDTSRCIWHAEVDDKPIQELVAAQLKEPIQMKIDGIYMQNIKSSGNISFQSCRMIGADFSGANLRDTDLSDAVLIGSDFSEVNLTDADLWGAQFCFEMEDEDADLPITWVSSNLPKASLNGADLQNSILTYVDLSDTFANDVDFRNADLEMADLSDSSLLDSVFTGAFLWNADLSNADLQYVDLNGVSFQNAKFAGVRMNQETRIGKPEWEYDKEPQMQDTLARTYHRLGEAALENGLVGKARTLRIWERKARQKEAMANSDWQAVAGALISEYVMGYGVSVKRVSVAIIFTIFACAFLYLSMGIKGATTPLQALDYSLTTFTGIVSPTGPPTTQPGRSVAIFESFVGILFSVLLGYVLGTRESP